MPSRRLGMSLTPDIRLGTRTMCAYRVFTLDPSLYLLQYTLSSLAQLVEWPLDEMKSITKRSRMRAYY